MKIRYQKRNTYIDTQQQREENREEGRSILERIGKGESEVFLYWRTSRRGWSEVQPSPVQREPNAQEILGVRGRKVLL